jgi:hypothetical protein
VCSIIEISIFRPHLGACAGIEVRSSRVNYNITSSGIWMTTRSNARIAINVGRATLHHLGARSPIVAKTTVCVAVPAIGGRLWSNIHQRIRRGRRNISVGGISSASCASG